MSRLRRLRGRLTGKHVVTAAELHQQQCQKGGTTPRARTTPRSLTERSDGERQRSVDRDGTRHTDKRGAAAKASNGGRRNDGTRDTHAAKGTRAAGRKRPEEGGRGSRISAHATRQRRDGSEQKQQEGTQKTAGKARQRRKEERQHR